ncbi:TlyA family rRNA (cytidine-2'-O)-methyltransferase [Candidatus Saccharibacteria bacterium]|nr:TlyA family rRNA (cytidine-2'-O)-methyltransferase [Candidatus Saccharibacteria bacterium]
MTIGNEKNRGYYKIKGASSAFNFDFRGKIVLDIGSSTGGFTDYALEKGAKKVIAIEKGTNQMRRPLRDDPRIELHEKTDIFDVNKIGESLDAIVADVSFISLTKVLKHAKLNFADKSTDFLVMLKPQFEARSDQLVNGVVKNERIRREIIKGFEDWLKRNNFVIIKKRDNELKGKTGNQERFYWLRIAKKS